MRGRHFDQEKFEVKEKLQLRRNKKIRGEENKMHNGGDIKKTRREKRKMNE